ncbi:2'-5' RNA ligase family protein [Aurantimonas aggregata]|uniref:2'-5' RNA ligase family protein n=1 Tax=Aurantimonas aggregata TaxID=2047720 RepID=A0A6L9MMW8_9HYPH|nr:2'-5' RNA ligase family protein [Aurantimonas aggregata]
MEREAGDAAPLILTLRFDPESFARFDGERRRDFPPERNLIPAHLTLFHHLPGDRYADVAAAVATRASRHAPFPLAITGLRFLGQGTAYRVESPPLVALRAELAAIWAADLTRQDAQDFRPHVTFQNKAHSRAAKGLFEALSETIEPFEATATGLLLWHYRGGPWEAAGQFDFGAARGPIPDSDGFREPPR